MSDITPNQEKEVQKEEVKSTSKKRVGLWILLVVLILLLGGLTAGYFYVADYYKTHFLPNTTVNDITADQMTAAEVTQILDGRKLQYELVVTGKEDVVIGVLTQDEIGLHYIGVQEAVEAALAVQNPYQWVSAWLGRSHRGHDLIIGTDFDREQTITYVEQWPALDPKNMVAPQDAYISEYLPDIKGYQVVEETQGNTLDAEAVKQRILSAVEAREASVDLEEEDFYLTAKITVRTRDLEKKCEMLNHYTAASVTYDWNGRKVVVDGDLIHQWLIIGEDTVSVDEEQVKEFVEEQAAKYDTWGQDKDFTTTSGQVVHLKNGSYGWWTNVEKETEKLLGLLEEGAVTEREPAYRSKGQKKGANDLGNTYVEIDLTNQHLYLYYDGVVVLETDFVSGNMSNGNTTPPGLFGLTYKTTNAVLRGRDYVTPVTYWMPFNGNIGMHDATWRNQFGGDIYLTNGSHGCINLPLDKAAAIYPYMTAGFPIICYY